VLKHLADLRWREVVVLATQLKRKSRETIAAFADALDQLKTPEIQKVLTRVRRLMENCLGVPSLAHKLVALGFAVHDYDLTSEVYWDKSFAAGPYKVAFSLDWK